MMVSIAAGIDRMSLESSEIDSRRTWSACFHGAVLRPQLLDLLADRVVVERCAGPVDIDLRRSGLQDRLQFADLRFDFGIAHPANLADRHDYIAPKKNGNRISAIKNTILILDLYPIGYTIGA